jgi:hypothetical protein
MTLTWGAPAALWLLLGVPLVWLADLVARTNFNRRQRLLQKTVRSLLLTAVVLALARPVISNSSSHQSVVYAVDVSDSVASHAIETAAAKIDELNGALRPSHTRIVTFGRDGVTIESTEALRQLAKTRTQTPSPRGPDGSSTDLEAALYAARGELATEHVPRVVLSATDIPRAATPVRRSPTSRQKGFPCRRSRSRLDRSAMRGSTRSTCRRASPAARC